MKNHAKKFELTILFASTIRDPDNIRDERKYSGIEKDEADFFIAGMRAFSLRTHGKVYLPWQ